MGIDTKDQYFAAECIGVGRSLARLDQGLNFSGGHADMRVGAISGRSAVSRTQRAQLAQKMAAPEAAPSASIVAPVFLLNTQRSQLQSDLSQLKGKGDNVDVTV